MQDLKLQGSLVSFCATKVNTQTDGRMDGHRIMVITRAMRPLVSKAKKFDFTLDSFVCSMSE